jgi:hypothetical protein
MVNQMRGISGMLSNGAPFSGDAKGLVPRLGLTLMFAVPDALKEVAAPDAAPAVRTLFWITIPVGLLPCGLLGPWSAWRQ